MISLVFICHRLRNSVILRVNLNAPRNTRDCPAGTCKLESAHRAEKPDVPEPSNCWTELHCATCSACLFVVLRANYSHQTTHQCSSNRHYSCYLHTWTDYLAQQRSQRCEHKRRSGGATTALRAGHASAVLAGSERLWTPLCQRRCRTNCTTRGKLVPLSMSHCIAEDRMLLPGAPYGTPRTQSSSESARLDGVALHWLL